MLLYIPIALVSAWIGYGIFSYATHTQTPHVSIQGITPNGHYKDTIAATLHIDTSYKLSHATLLIDDKPCDALAQKKITLTHGDIPFTIDSQELGNGQHKLDLYVTDASYHANKATISMPFSVDNTPLKAALTEQRYKIFQGKTLQVKISTNKKLAKASISLFGRDYPCHELVDANPVYECFIPIECEERAQEHTLVVKLEDLPHNTITLTAAVEIAEFPFKKQRQEITVSSKKLDEEKEVSMNTKILRDAIAKWMAESSREKQWSGPFEFPTEVKRISTPHGEIRVTPERGRYLHQGIDIVNNPRSVVWASQNGKIVIKDRYLMTGNTVVIDHGCGVATLYAHLDSFADIEVGEYIKKGNPIGKLGMTGYATGHHLHWELLVNNVAVDPLEWINTIY